MVKIDDFLAYSQGTKDHMTEMMKMMQRMEATIVSQVSSGGQKRSIGMLNDRDESVNTMEEAPDATDTNG